MTTSSMGNRNRTSLSRLLDDLGTTLLELIAGIPNAIDEVGGVVIHDSLDTPVFPQRAIVLGVGVGGVEQVVELLAELGSREASALVVRGPVAIDERLIEASRASSVALLGLTRGASWAQLAAMLRSMLAEGDVGAAGPETLGGVPAGDLFALANAIADLIDAPVTIEDRNSRVMAFSGRQNEADDGRIETILGRQVPEKYARMLTDRGVFNRLYRSDQPIYIEPSPDDATEFAVARVATTVRAGDEILGSIWAAVSQPLDEHRERALTDAAKLVALHLLRIRAGADVERRLRADLVSTALEGGAGAQEAINRLGLVDQPAIVVALEVPLPHDPSLDADASLAGERHRLADAFTLHLSAVHPRCAVALIGDVAYGIVPMPRDRTDAELRASRIAHDFLERIGDRIPVLIGIGSFAGGTGELVMSRTSAEQTLRVLRSSASSQRVAAISDIYIDSLLYDLHKLNATRTPQLANPIARLSEYDDKHNTKLLDSLHAWLNAFGDVQSACEGLFVHPNTFRYRLRRLSEVGGIDLGDPDARFAAMVQLRMMRYGQSRRDREV